MDLEAQENKIIEILNYDLTTQEFPSKKFCLTFSIFGCMKKTKCKGCHTPECWIENKNNPDIKKLLYFEIIKIIEEHYYKGLIDTIVWLGSDYYEENIKELTSICKEKFIADPLNYVFYTSKIIEEIDNSYKVFDYVKCGSYIEDLSGGSFGSTNQKMYKSENNYWKDLKI